MKTQKLDAVQVWKQMEDLAIPRLKLSVYERAVYSHLLRHSRLEGKVQIRFSILRVARGACLSTFAVRSAVRSLAAKGALRLVERSRTGHLVEVRLPEEIRAVHAGKSAAGREMRPAGVDNLEEVDFLETKELRETIHRREGGRCFYCLHRVTRMTRCLDHVVPRARNGSNRYRNVVSACVECNSQKRERPAPDFLRWLFREGRLDGAELKGRQQALKALAAGELRPRMKGSKQIRK